MTDNITLTRATVQQVLDALERTNSEPGSMAYEREAKASVALEDALRAAPQQKAEPVMLNGMTEVETNATASVLGLTKQAEPIGWLDGNDKLAEFMHRDLKADHDKRGSATPRDFTVPVYTAPPQQAEPVHGDIRALKYRIHELEGEVLGYKRMLDVAEAAAQRKPLTDEQADQIISGLQTCHHQSSKREFLKVWLRDWAAHGLKEGT